MKLINILLILLFLLQSCYKQDCDCVIKCTWFHENTIEICSNDYSNSQLYQAVYDSLAQKYYDFGTRDSISKSIYIAAGFDHNKAKNNEINELESEGYICTCADPK